MSDPAPLKGKVALVSGAGSGIGEATAHLLAREGARVGVADVNEPAVVRVTDQIRAEGGSARAVLLDVRREASWEAALADVQEAWGSLDVLVNSADISAACPLAEATLDHWHRVFAVNLDGVFLGTRGGIRAMGRGAGGVVVNLASTAGMKVYPGAAAYASSKAAVIHLSRVAARECEQAGNGVRVHVVVPGGVRTPMWKSQPFWEGLAAAGEEHAWSKLDPDNAFHSAEDIAIAIVDLVQRESAETVLVLDRSS